MLQTSILVIFFLTGTLAGIFLSNIPALKRKYIIKWYAWIMMITGIVILLFTIAWSLSSVVENEPQSAGMSLIVFGVPGLCLLLFTKRILIKTDTNI
ncbi:MAG: dehalogenase [Desulfobacteraceae bacterium]|nr:dehalogenase [Desulfobacteraceae bacterium]